MSWTPDWELPPIGDDPRIEVLAEHLYQICVIQPRPWDEEKDWIKDSWRREAEDVLEKLDKAVPATPSVEYRGVAVIAAPNSLKREPHCPSCGERLAQGLTVHGDPCQHCGKPLISYEMREVEPLSDTSGYILVEGGKKHAQALLDAGASPEQLRLPGGDPYPLEGLRLDVRRRTTAPPRHDLPWWKKLLRRS